MARIHQLPPSVVNKIAAGEVIERPASVVKELLENAIDAGADHVEVAIENGGAGLICVSDNGCGISGDELALAVTSHATSKISDADDLFRVTTFGFRGEALASIAEISHFMIRSRTAGADSGNELVVVGGRRQSVEPCACAVGTVITVEQLFFNTPVRQKFMRTAQTESGHITEAFTRIALANPSVRMVLKNGQRVVHDLSANHTLTDRILALFGPDIRNALIPISGVEGQIELEGFVVNPTHSRSHNRMQYLMLNGRYIRDRSLGHALSESYRGLLLTGRHPIAFLNLRMPPELVDVNVHPAKLEVRFVDGGRLYSQLLKTIRERFLSSDLTAHAQLNPALPPGPAGSTHGGQIPGSNPQFQPFPNAGTGTSDLAQHQIPFSASQPSRDWTSSPANPHVSVANPAASPATGEHAIDSPAPAIDSAGPSITRHDRSQSNTSALQIHNRYLITESEEGVVVIDQHALHERVIYEQLREKVLAGALETQQLLVPEPVHLSPSELALVEQSADELRKIGIELQPFGGDTVLISAYPAMLANQNPGETLRAVVDLLVDSRRQPQRRDIIDELMHMIACKAAVKAGDRLSIEEIDALLEHRQLCQDSHHCPHGRPTSLVFSREELDRRFKRI